MERPPHIIISIDKDGEGCDASGYVGVTDSAGTYVETQIIEESMREAEAAAFRILRDLGVAPPDGPLDIEEGRGDVYSLYWESSEPAS